MVSLKEELYMMQPEGFVDPKNANKVCKLQRSIYGLVQASRSWNIPFDKVIKAYGFIQTYGEACIYKKVNGSSIAFLIVYVDDILLFGNGVEFLESIMGCLKGVFQRNTWVKLLTYWASRSIEIDQDAR